MKIKALILLGVFALGAAGVAEVAAFPRARLTIHVIGEDGQPIQAANVEVDFNVRTKDSLIGAVIGPTDTNGNFTAEGEGSAGTLGGGVTKDGYYRSGFDAPPLDRFKDGHWLPWDGTYTTVLRKIEKPISMYVKNAYSEIPSTTQSCGYDLEAGDWIAPWGKGTVADFVVTLKRQYQDIRNYDDTVVISFSNPGDGIQETTLPKEFANSMFKWQREAPETDYQPTLFLHLSSSSATGMHGDLGDNFYNKKYFFRVRTEKQGDQIVSALYGKINAGISLAPNAPQTCGISIFYYLNPTPNDRNLEWDPTKNLAPTPKDPSLQVRAP
jgi:hypothetical protein